MNWWYFAPDARRHNNGDRERRMDTSIPMNRQTQNSSSVTVAQGIPATERTTFTLTGLPSGTNSFLRVVSCKGGQDNHYGFKDYFVL